MTDELTKEQDARKELIDSPEIGVNFIDGKTPSFANLEKHKRFVSFLFSITGSRYYQGEEKFEEESPAPSNLSSSDLVP
ncbi:MULTISPECIES: hypothetical protein [Roseivirga]|jgi:hypothetical protein|uniref:Uncharacterized protein n=1 Tax=Roseivirga spongicola TaxID=333140 RepID=A0A150XEV1_9BACT|nr:MULTISPECIES: hypothetical protein [Roseivirga]KYG77233.1 hypothetical protein AWW68_00240 [Roseivirga spongicola]MBO6496587.1 hypothetical protein [Roseivirga sp.]MBO6662682.1 hypothetical protein [Roseivirga sp.]MBO6759809.1 hypothetical protein [Roseivirga sp.]MBO6909689.1 hypothetical protein [Roseivirga sp.]